MEEQEDNNKYRPILEAFWHFHGEPEEDVGQEPKIVESEEPKEFDPVWLMGSPYTGQSIPKELRLAAYKGVTCIMDEVNAQPASIYNITDEKHRRDYPNLMLWAVHRSALFGKWRKYQGVKG